MVNRNKLGNKVNVVYEKAVNFTNDTLSQSSEGNYVKTDFGALVARLKDADAIVFVGGITPRLEGEGMRVNYPGFQGKTITMRKAVQQVVEVK